MKRLCGVRTLFNHRRSSASLNKEVVKDSLGFKSVVVEHFFPSTVYANSLAAACQGSIGGLPLTKGAKIGRPTSLFKSFNRVTKWIGRLFIDCRILQETTLLTGRITIAIKA